MMLNNMNGKYNGYTYEQLEEILYKLKMSINDIKPYYIDKEILFKNVKMLFSDLYNSPTGYNNEFMDFDGSSFDRDFDIAREITKYEMAIGIKNSMGIKNKFRFVVILSKEKVLFTDTYLSGNKFSTGHRFVADRIINVYEYLPDDIRQNISCEVIKILSTDPESFPNRIKDRIAICNGSDSWELMLEDIDKMSSNRDDVRIYYTARNNIYESVLVEYFEQLKERIDLLFKKLDCGLVIKDGE